MNHLINITDFNAPELDIYARLTEPKLRHLYEQKGGIFIAESPYVIERALEAGCIPISILVEDKQLRNLAEEITVKYPDIPVYVSTYEVLKNLTGIGLTRGMLCAFKRPSLPSAEEICAGARRIVILENVMNPVNIGAIFRSGAALGMDAILLTPGCSDPFYRRAARVSMGTVFQVPWTYIGEKAEQWPGDGMERLRRMGFRTAAMALRDNTIDIDDPRLAEEEKLAVLMGTEGDGLSSQTIADCDYTIKIPMYHNVDSLNVAAASAVAFWELRAR